MEKSERKVKLLTDTCSLMKLLAAGEKLFEESSLEAGCLLVHPVVFNETRRWHKTKKKKYKSELDLLNKIKSTSGIRVSGHIKIINEKLIYQTADNLEKIIGSADAEQISSAMNHDMCLVTNDGPMSDVASALEVEVWTAEQVLVEAIRSKVIFKNEANKLVNLWRQRNEKPPTKKDRHELESFGVKFLD